MNRSHWILTGVLAVQIVLLLLVYTGGDGDGAGQPHLFLDGLPESQQVRIIIASGDDGALSISRQEGSWALDGHHGFPADRGRVEKLLEDLGSLLVRRPVVSNSRYHAALKVTEEDHENKISIWTEGGEEPSFEIYFGTSPNYRIHHIRRAGDDRVFEESVIGAFDLNTEPGAWIDRNFVTVPHSAVTARVKLRNAHGEFDLKSVEGEWVVSPTPVPPGNEPDPGEVDSWILSLINLQSSEPAGPVDDGEHGFTQPAAELELTYEFEMPASDNEAEPDGVEGVRSIGTVRIVIGKEIPEGGGKRFASREGFDFSVILGKWEAEKLTEKKLQDLFPSD